MFSRRHVLKQLVALGAIAGFGSLPGARAAFAAGEPGAAARYHMPEESSPQALVWVAFGATSEIWGRHYKEVQATIGRLVQAMVPYTRVNVLCHEDDEALARQFRGRAASSQSTASLSRRQRYGLTVDVTAERCACVSAALLFCISSRSALVSACAFNCFALTLAALALAFSRFTRCSAALGWISSSLMSAPHRSSYLSPSTVPHRS